MQSSPPLGFWEPPKLLQHTYTIAPPPLAPGSAAALHIHTCISV